MQSWMPAATGDFYHPADSVRVLSMEGDGAHSYPQPTWPAVCDGAGLLPKAGGRTDGDFRPGWRARPDADTWRLPDTWRLSLPSAEAQSPESTGRSPTGDGHPTGNSAALAIPRLLHPLLERHHGAVGSGAGRGTQRKEVSKSCFLFFSNVYVQLFSFILFPHTIKASPP